MEFPKGFDVSGMPEQPVVVLLHSSLSSSAQWSRLVTQLRNTYRVVNVDLLGYGSAPEVTDADHYCLNTEVLRIAEGLAEMELKKFDLIGHSFGGAVALKYANEFSQQVNRLVIFEPVAFHLLEPGSNARTEIELIAEKIRDVPPMDGARMFVDYWNGEGYFDTLPPPVCQMLSAQIHKVKLDFKGLIGEALTLQDYQTSCPSGLLLAGKQSPAASRSLMTLLKDNLNGFSFCEVSGGHMAPISHAEEVNQQILDYLGQSDN